MDIVDRFYEILDNHDMTACRAREILEYRSPNSLTRIVQRNVSQNILMDFAERLVKHADEFEMTPEEVASIEEGAQELTLGMGNMTGYRMLKDLLLGQNEETGKEKLEPLSSSFSGRSSVRALDPEGITSFRVVILGGCPERYLQAFAALEGKVDLHVDYYYEDDMTPLPAMRMLNLTFPWLNKPWFRAYRIHREHPPLRLSGSLMQIDAVRYDKKESALYIPRGDDPVIRLPINETHPNARELFLEPSDRVDPIRLEGNEFKDYAKFLRYCRKRERNHRMVRIKPDIGLEMIPPKVQAAAVLPDSGLLPSLPVITKIQDDRYKNYQSRKFHQYHIMDYEAMKHFTLTGELSDHPKLMRPFTANETLTILQDLLAQARRSRYLHLHFLKEGVEIKTGEVLWNEGSGVSFLMKGTNYDFDQEYTELEINDHGFESFFGGFFAKRFASEMAHTQEESIVMLEGLVELCRHRLEKEKE